MQRVLLGPLGSAAVTMEAAVQAASTQSNHRSCLFPCVLWSSSPQGSPAPAHAAAPKPDTCAVFALSGTAVSHLTPQPVLLQSALLRHPQQRHRQAMTPSKATMVGPKQLMGWSQLSTNRQPLASRQPYSLCSGIRFLLGARQSAVSEACRKWGRRAA